MPHPVGVGDGIDNRSTCENPRQSPPSFRTTSLVRRGDRKRAAPPRRVGRVPVEELEDRLDSRSNRNTATYTCRGDSLPHPASPRATPGQAAARWGTHAVPFR